MVWKPTNATLAEADEPSGWFPEGAVPVQDQPPMPKAEDTWEYVLKGGSIRDTFSLMEQDAHDKLMSTIERPDEFEAAMASSMYLASIFGHDPSLMRTLHNEVTGELYGEPLPPSQMMRRAISDESDVERYVTSWNQLASDPKVTDLGWSAEVKNALARGGLSTVMAPVVGTAGAAARFVARSPLARMIYPWQAQAADLPAMETKGKSLQGIAKIIYDESGMESLKPRKDGAMGFVVNTLFETVPMMAAATVAGLGVGSVGAWMVGAMAEGEAQFQTIMEQLKDRTDLTQGQKERIANTQRLVVGSINGFIELAQFKGVLKISGEFSKETLKLMKTAVAERSLAKIGGIVGMVGLADIANGHSEGFEEVLQYLVSKGGAVLEGDEIVLTEDAYELLQNYVGGVTAGIGLGQAGRVIQTGVAVNDLYKEQRAQLRMTAARQKIESVNRRRFTKWNDQVKGMEETAQEFAREQAREEAISQQAPAPGEAPAALSQATGPTVITPQEEGISGGEGLPVPAEGQPAAVVQPTAQPTPTIESAKSTPPVEMELGPAEPPTIDTILTATAGEGQPLPEEMSLRHANIQQDREALGLSGINSASRVSKREAIVEARKRKIPEQAEAVASEAIKSGRMMDRAERAGLLIRVTQLKNQYDSLMKQIGASGSDAVTGRLSALINRTEDEFDLITSALFQSGSEAGRALEFQKLTLARDMSPIAVRRRAKAAKGAELTPQETAKFKELTDNLNGKDEQINLLNKEVAKLKAAAATGKIAGKPAAKVTGKSQRTKKTRYSKMSRSQITSDRASTIAKIRALMEAGCYDA